MSPDIKTHGLSRVFMTADTVGGVWSYALELMAGLARRGIEIHLAVLGPAPAPVLEQARRIAGVTAFAAGLPLDWTARSAAELEHATEELVRLAEAGGADVIHLNTPGLAAARYPAPIVAVAHSCVATWWRACYGGPLPDDFVWRTAMTARGLRAADAIVTPSASFAAAVAETYGSDLAIAPVLNGRTLALPQPSPVKQRCVLAAGRLWDEGKNVAALDRAAAQLDAPFFAAGPVIGPNGARIQLAYLQPLGALDAERLASWYERASIFASAARYEPFGLTALEAAGAGAALVLSDIPTFRELWDGAAVFVADENAFGSVLQDLLDHPARVRDLAAAARMRAMRYSAEAMVDGLLDVYRSAQARPRRAAA